MTVEGQTKAERYGECVKWRVYAHCELYPLEKALNATLTKQIKSEVLNWSLGPMISSLTFCMNLSEE